MNTRRWIRLDASWDTSEWLDEVSGMARYAWICLLCYVKRDGVRGRVRCMSTKVFSRRIDAAESSIVEMLDAAERDGAIVEEDGEWILPNWDRYQTPDAARMRRNRHPQENYDTI